MRRPAQKLLVVLLFAFTTTAFAACISFGIEADEGIWLQSGHKHAGNGHHISADTDSLLNAAQLRALKKIDSFSASLHQSSYFKNLNPQNFIAQLKDRIRNPYELNQGKTLFCWVATPLAFTYNQYPSAMAEAMYSLYVSREFHYVLGAKNISFSLPQNSMDAVGSETFSKQDDALSGNLVDQMLFMSFAEHYKCWINIDRHFDPGDQLKPTWAGATLEKATRVWKDFANDVEEQGFDLFWWKNNKAAAVAAALKRNKIVMLYINAPNFHKDYKKMSRLRSRFPFMLTGSHYILVLKIESRKDGCNITFWDDDGIQKDYVVSNALFQESVYGFTAISKLN